MADEANVLLLDRDSRRTFGIAATIELEYWTLLLAGQQIGGMVGQWSVKDVAWTGPNPELQNPILKTQDGGPIRAVFLPTNAQIAHAQTFEASEFSFRPRTDGGLKLMSSRQEIAELARGTGEWIINPGFAYDRVVFSAVPVAVPDVTFTPTRRSRLSPLAARAKRLARSAR